MGMAGQAPEYCANDMIYFMPKRMGRPPTLPWLLIGLVTAYSLLEMVFYTLIYSLLYLFLLHSIHY
jgi:hypothetical protein